MRYIAMRLICSLTLVLILVLFSASVNGQVSGDYRSNVATGNWNTVGSWQTYNGTTWVAAAVAPNSTNANVITVQNGHAITVTSSVSIDQTIIQPTGSVIVNSNKTLTIVDGPGNDLTINGTLTVNGILSINNPALVITSSATLNLNGDFINEGTYNGLSSTTTFDGVTIVDGTGSTSFNDMTLLTGADVAIEGIDVGLNGVLTLEGTSVFDADGSGAGVFTLISTGLSSTASIAILPTPSNFSGDVTIQRYVNSPEDWRYLSFPVSGANVGMLQDNIQVTGNFSNPSSGGNVVSSSSPSIYYFNAPTQAWTAVGSGGSVASTSLSGTTGYSVWSYLTTDATIDIRGTIGKGNVPLSLSTGDNLIPNPYPSPINWDNVDFTGANLVSNTAYVRTALNTYTAYLSGGPTTGLLALGQSFWVIGAGSGTLTFHEADKTSNATFVRKQTPSDYISVKLNKGNLTDEVFVHFREGATLGTDVQYDAIKKLNEIDFNLSVYNTDPSVDYAINGVPFINCNYTTNLKLGASNPVGAYSLSFADLSTLSHDYNVVLIDKFLNVEKPVTEGMIYAFEITASAASKSSDRFKLLFESPIESPVIDVNGSLLSVQAGLGTYQWYSNDQAIAGATGNSIKATTSGTYYVSVATTDCSVNSENVTYAITGLEKGISSYSAFPNPAVGNEFKIEGPNLGNAQIHIFDNLGRALPANGKLEVGTDGNKYYLGDLSGHGEGLYILRIVNEKKIVQLKIVKQ